MAIIGARLHNLSHLCITSGRQYCNLLSAVLQAGLEFLPLINIVIPYIIQHNKVSLPTYFRSSCNAFSWLISLGLADVACNLNNFKITTHNNTSGVGNTPWFLGHVDKLSKCLLAHPSHSSNGKGHGIPVASLRNEYTHGLLFSSSLDMLTMSFSEWSMMEFVMRHYIDAVVDLEFDQQGGNITKGCIF